MKKKLLIVIVLAALLVCAVAASGVFTEKEIPDADPETAKLYEIMVPEEGAAVIYDVDDSVEVANIPAKIDGRKVTAIRERAFYFTGSLKEVTIPDTVTSIGSFAFCSCNSLESVSIPESVTFIGEGAFSDCPSLSSIQVSPRNRVFTVENGMLINRKDKTVLQYFGRDTDTCEIPKGIRRIGTGAFRGSSLTAVKIPDSVTSFGHLAFYSMRNLEELTIPEGVASIGDSLLWGCSSLKTLSLPASLTDIGYGIFSECRSLDTVTIAPGNPVYEMRENMLVNKKNNMLACHLDRDSGAFTIPEGIEIIEKCAFAYSSGLTEIFIPDSVKVIKEDAFLNSLILKIRLPEGLKKIERDTFWGCRRLRSVTIPDSVVYIDYGAFCDCTMLEEAVISAGVSVIKGGAFRDCKVLAVRAPAGSRAQEYCEKNGIGFEASDADPAETARKPEQEPAREETAAAEVSGREESSSVSEEITGELYRYTVKEDGTAEITDANDKYMETLDIPAELDGYRVTSIGPSAFHSMRNLETVIIPEGVTTLKDTAFWGCNNLKSVSIPNSLVSVAYMDLFTSGDHLEKVEVSPDHPLFAVENRALINKQDRMLIRFLDDGDTGSYEISRGIRELGTNAFANSRLSSVIIPDTVTTLGSGAFIDCENLTELVIPDSVVELHNEVFFGCSSLQSVNIPDHVVNMGIAQFYGCENLKTVTISPDHLYYEMVDGFLVEKNNREIMGVCWNDTGKYVIPEGIRSIYTNSFWGIENLTELVIPDSVVEIGDDLFSHNLNGKLVVKACAGSAAQRYCEENGIKFEILK